MIEGNHFFQGDDSATGIRTAGIVFCKTNVKSVVVGNYVDNSMIEWGNEHDEDPDGLNTFSFGALSITGNIFTSASSAAWFRFIQIRPYGPNHYLNGVNISGNVFKHTGGGSLERVDGVDTSIGGIVANKLRNVTIVGNSFHNVDLRMESPVVKEIDENGVSDVWSTDLAEHMPFGGKARRVTAVMPTNEIKDSGGSGVYTLPYAVAGLGADGTEVKLHWSKPVTGKVLVTVQTDLTA